MADSFPFLPFPVTAGSSLLSRYLPILPAGLTGAWLSGGLPAGSLVLDPFGSQPRLALEAASLGYRVLVACNNPVERFLLELEVNPPTHQGLRAALADLAVSAKGDQRLEAHIRSLYRTECANCGESIEAQAFIWDREREKIHERIYRCRFCGDSGIHPASQADLERAAQFKKGSLNWFRAIERVAPKGDPDRVHVVEALETYTPRALYALVSLVNKLDQYPAARQRELRVLLLTTFDLANSLWSPTSARERPRQLKPSTYFIERNVWQALEESLSLWAEADRIVAVRSFSQWPELPTECGGICVFPGPLRGLAEQWEMRGKELPGIQGLLAAIPRPNQAYWSLSTLWAGWLWGPQATGPFKRVLRRRRYDWHWHCAALSSAWRNLPRMVEQGTPFWSCIGECEPGFLAAALIAAWQSNFRLEGLGYREESDQAQIRWSAFSKQPTEAALPQEALDGLQAACQELALAHLAERNEPASFQQLHAGVLGGLFKSRDNQLTLPGAAVEMLTSLQTALNLALNDRKAFVRLGASERSPESGKWWFSPDRRFLAGGGESSVFTLADRVETSVVHFLTTTPDCSFEQVDQAVCRSFDGLLTPDQELVRQCLDSYGKPAGAADKGWQLKEQEEPDRRRADLKLVSSLIERIGQYLALEVSAGQVEEGLDFIQPPLSWRDREGKTVYTFYFLTSAACSQLVNTLHSPDVKAYSSLVKTSRRRNIVLPGGRSRLLLFKFERNLHLKRLVEDSWRLIKFRLVHRLADNLSFDLAQLEHMLELDPLEHDDPQIPLI